MPGGPGNQRKQLVEKFGNACQRCGYNRNYKVLHFHHQDSSEKNYYSHQKGRASLKEVNEHPERFILVCANCHAELHDESRVFASVSCAFCGKEFRTQPNRQQTGHDKYCSRKCVSAAQDAYALSFKSIENRFWKNIEKTDGCWNWKHQQIGTTPVMQVKQPSGKYTDRSVVRISYKLHFGEIPANRSVRRTCQNPRCVNPDHLELR
jgi:hypothetical protein